MHKVGISSFAYNFAAGYRGDFKPDHVMTPFELIDKASELGAEVVQISDNMTLEFYDADYLDEIRTCAEKCGIEIELGMRESTAERLEKYIGITQRLGGKLLRLITDGKEYKPSLDECCHVFSSLTPMLEEAGIVLAIENHDRFTSCEYAEMVKRVNHPNVGLTVDTVNSLSIEETLDEVLSNMAPYCACLHVKDYEIKRYNGGGGLKITGAKPGTGRLDLQRCYEFCCDKSRYDFNLILEAWMEPCETLEETLRTEDEWAAEGVKILRGLSME